MIKRMLEYIKQYRMIEPGDVVCIGLSGGADSVCLLLRLLALSRELSFQVQAVHVNHGLRGEESDQDQAFVEELCKERDVPLFVYACPVSKIAAEKHIGLEEAGRMVRQEIYSDCLEHRGTTKIALAHHRNDLAETLLFHLSRGTSLTGMAGILPVSGPVIRPLLCISREEIEHDLKSRGICWRTDSSNLQDDYTRNRIRHQVIPYLETHVNEKAVSHMAEAAEDLASADHFLREMAVSHIEKLMKEKEQGIWISDKLGQEPKILQGYMILEVLYRLAGSRKDLAREHVRLVRDLFQKQVGKRICLPYGMEGIREYEGVFLLSSSGELPAVLEEELLSEERLSKEDMAKFQFGAYEVACWLFDRNEEKIPEKTYTKWLDYDRIKDNLVMRTRKTGDYLVVDASGGRKKLKDYMIDQKIPRQERDFVPLLASGSEIFWVVGHRISESCKINRYTKRVLCIQVTGGKIHE